MGTVFQHLWELTADIFNVLKMPLLAKKSRCSYCQDISKSFFYMGLYFSMPLALPYHNRLRAEAERTGQSSTPTETELSHRDTGSRGESSRTGC